MGKDGAQGQAAADGSAAPGAGTEATSPWASPLGRWLRGLVHDAASELPSLSETIAAVRNELENSSTLGVLFVRLEHWGHLSRMYSWRELEEIYRGASQVALGSLGSGIRAMDLPADVGLQGEGFAVVLSAPREALDLSLPMVDSVAERLETAINEHLARSLVPRVHERLSITVGGSVLHAPRGEQTLEDLIVSALVEADEAARQKQWRQRELLGERLEEFLEEGDLTPLFRPLVHLRQGKVVGYQVGLRGPASTNLRYDDVLFDVARRTGLEHRVLDAYHEAVLSHEHLADRGDGFLLISAGSSELIESAVRINSLLYGAPGRNLSARDIVFLVDTGQVLRHFPISLASFRSVSELGFRLALDLQSDCPLPLDYVRELEPDFLRLSGRSIRGVHREQDEFDLLYLIGRFAVRRGIEVIAADCDDRQDALVLRKAGVGIASGELFAPASTRPVKADISPA